MIDRFRFDGLPKELEPFYIYYQDCGKCILSILECHFNEAVESGKFKDYLVGVPCSYVLRKGYRLYNGYVIVDAPYSKELGLLVDEEDW